MPQRLPYFFSRIPAFSSTRLVARHQGSFMSLAWTQTTAPTGCPSAREECAFVHLGQPSRSLFGFRRLQLCP
jgi:hypothetical protein